MFLTKEHHLKVLADAQGWKRVKTIDGDKMVLKRLQRDSKMYPNGI